MRYLLDSNTISDLYNQQSQTYSNLLARLGGLSHIDEVFISVLSLYELEYGYENSPLSKKAIIRKKIDEIISDFTALPLKQNGSHYFARLKKQVKESRNLKKKDMRQFNIDLMLASTAITEGCILVSADKIYPELAKNLPEFQVEDWTI